VDKQTACPPILKPPVKTAGNTDSSKSEAAECAEKLGSPLEVSSRDYKPLDYAEHRAHCAACGRKGVDYIEKLTPERKARKDKMALRICKKCYLASKRREQTEAPPLPGTIVLARMVRTTKDIGRCSVCNLGKAVFTDKETMTNICQQCYDRETRTSGSANGGAGQ
jgi:hypothetical protein